jgi:hypothetical protein
VIRATTPLWYALLVCIIAVLLAVWLCEAAKASVTVTTGAGVTMSADPDQPQVLIQCLTPGSVALELRDTWGNTLMRLNCPAEPKEQTK